MRFPVIAGKFCLFLLLASCASGGAGQHYVGHFTGTSDVLIEGQGNPNRGVEAWYESNGNLPILFTQYLNRRDTLEFLRDSSGWHWIDARSWGADIQSTADSLYLSFGWGYGGESFYLKRVK